MTCCFSHRTKQDKGQGFGSTSSQASSSGKKAEPRKEDRRWQLKAANAKEWEAWVEAIIVEKVPEALGHNC